MLTKVRGQQGLLICSDCAAPVPSDPGKRGTVSSQSGLLLVAMAAFVLLLLFLTSLQRIGINPPPGEAPSQKINAEGSESGSRE